MAETPRGVGSSSQPAGSESGTWAFLFSDIEGSTQLLLRLGDRYDDILELHRDIVRAAIARHGGDEQGTEGDSFVHVSVPRLTKLDLADFSASRDAYDRMNWDEKLLAHAWLLDLGTMLCEPSTRFEGMAGECIWGCACWVVVPLTAVRGEEAGQRVAP